MQAHGNTKSTSDSAKHHIKESLDTIYSMEYIYSIAGATDNPAKYIIDSLERREIKSNYKDIPSYRFLLTRGYIASRELKPHIALYYTNKAFNSPELQQDTKDYLMATYLLSNEYFVLKRMEKSVEYSLLYLKRAKLTKHYCEYAIGLLNYWLAHSTLNTSKAIKEIHEARKILRENPDCADSTQIIWSYEVEASIFITQKKYAEAIPLYEQILNIYRNMTPSDRKGTEVESNRNFKFKSGQTHITLAMLYAHVKNFNTAKFHYEAWKELSTGQPPVLSGELFSNVVEYLKTIGDYKSALDYSLAFNEAIPENDSINIFTLNLKQQLSQIYVSLHDYKNAYKYRDEASIISDSLYNRSNYETAVEMAMIYQINEKQSTILEQELIISRTRMYIWIITTLSISITIIVIIILINYRKISRKNIALFKQINQLYNIQNGVNSVIQTAIIQNMDNQDESCLFLKLQQLMTEKQSYLDPDITRESIAYELGTNKLYLSNAIREKTSLSFTEYINTLKLEYAKKILLNDFDNKIETISIMCGYRSVRTFYRLFQKKYNLSPAEFRKIAQQTQK